MDKQGQIMSRGDQCCKVKLRKESGAGEGGGMLVYLGVPDSSTKKAFKQLIIHSPVLSVPVSN